MSIEVSIDDLMAQVGEWGFCYLLTVSDDERPHLLALRPTVVADHTPALRFEVGGGRAGRNASARPDVSLVFPPRDDGGMSLVVDGVARVDGPTVDVVPTRAVLHRAAP